MKTILLILALMLACACARGQVNPSSVILLEADGKLTKQCGTEPRVPPLAVPPPMNSTGFGVPKQLGGNCTEAIMTADGVGGAVGWWCAQPEPERARLYLFAVEWDKITMPMVLDFGQLLLMSDKAARITQMHRTYQSLNIRDMCNIWNPLVDRLNAVYPAPLPVLKTWTTVGGTVFKSNGTYLLGITTKKVTAGKECLTNVAPIMSGVKVYYPLKEWVTMGGAVDMSERVECKQG